MSIKLLGGRLVANAIFIPVTVFMCWLKGIDAVAAFLAALVIHEAAHATVSSALGVHVYSLEVMPFGCAAHMESFTVISGGKEIAMALAGPLANIVAAAAVYVAGRIGYGGQFASAFFQSSVMLGAMNLLPALPLDGGRVIATLLALGMPRQRAVKITAGVGVAVSLAMLGMGVAAAVDGVLNPTIFLMGGFMLWSSIGYFRNATFAFMRSTTEKRSAVLGRGLVDVKSMAAHRDKRAGEVLSQLDGRKYNVIYVLDDKMEVMGRLTEGQLMDEVVKGGTAKRLVNMGFTREKV